MRIVIVDTYYARFLAAHYASHKGLRHQNYAAQLASLLEVAFGTSNFYSRHLNTLGCEAVDLIANCAPLQATWAREHGVPFHEFALKVPHRLYRLPAIGRYLAALPGLLDVAIAQIRAYRPDVLYCQDLSFFPGDVLQSLKKDVGLVVGQIACPLPADSFLKGYDLILTSFPHFVDRIRALGIRSDYFRIGFDTRMLDVLGNVTKDVPISFVGGISRNHTKAIPLLEYLAEETPIQFFGYGARRLPRRSPIRKKHHGEVWGVDMYRALARSKLTLNRHIDVAENHANNMRLYEATGVGTLLITDRKDNLGELFEMGKEVVVYSTPEEAAEMIRYYLDHPDEAEQIAKAGQARTLSEHTYEKRMEELVPILQHYLGR